MTFRTKLLVLVSLLIRLSVTTAIRGHPGSLRRRKAGSLVGDELFHKKRMLAHWGAVTDPSATYHSMPNNGARKKDRQGKSYDEDDEEPSDGETDYVLASPPNPAPEGKRGKNKKGKTTDSDDSDDGDDGGDVDFPIECDDPSDPQCQGECDDPSNPLCARTSANGVAHHVTDQLDEEDLLNPSDIDADENTDEDLEDAQDLEDGEIIESPALDDGSSGIEEGMDDEQSQEGIGNPEGISGIEIPDQVVPGTDGFEEGHSPVSDTFQSPTNTIDRSITPFKLSYAISGTLYKADLDDGDYAELSDNTVLFLTRYFSEYYTDEPTEFVETDVMMQKTDDALTIRLFVTTSFAIPGNVPTMNSLFDRMNDAFAGEHAQQYVLILNEMGSGNPFRHTRSIALINEAPASVAASRDEKNSRRSPIANNTPKLISTIIGAVLLALVIVGLLWVWRKSRENASGELKQSSLDEDIKMVERSKMEANTLNYLRKIRNRHEDDEGSKTDLEDVSLDGPGSALVDHGMIGCDRRAVTRKNVGSKRESDVIMHQLQDMADHSFPAPPSEDGGSERGGNDCRIREGTLRKEKNAEREKYLEYLDLKASFEEEDLRT